MLCQRTPRSDRYRREELAVLLRLRRLPCEALLLLCLEGKDPVEELLFQILEASLERCQVEKHVLRSITSASWLLVLVPGLATD